jgi:predicted nucleotidyltransferase
MNSLRSLAQELGIPERTLRRAAAEGLIHGERLSPRRFRTSLREESYLRSHWPLLRELRGALRTEPNIRLAVLFGSLSTGRAVPSSDVDLLVALSDDDIGRLADLSGRLSRRLGRDVQLVRLADAERSAVRMATALDHGRVLVDRDGRWPALKVTEARWQRRARRAEVPLEEALDDLAADMVSAP